MIRYDTLNLRVPKSWQTASLICRTEPNKKKTNEETKDKNQDAQKKWSSHKVRGVSPEARKGVYGGKGLWKSRQWKTEGVMDGESGELTGSWAWTGKSETKGLE